jgi:hypothetical protein
VRVRIAWGRWRRVALVAGTSGTVLALLVAGLHSGYPATRPRLGSGTAWLPSYRVGQLTLLDGSTAEVDGQVQVAAAGDRIDAVQRGSTAYAVDRTTGTVRRVDGATFQAGTPRTLIADARDGLVAYPTDTDVYVLDTDRGLLALADAQTLAQQGNPRPVSAGSAVLDDTGRLWTLDPATGDVTGYEDGQARVRAHVAGSGALVLAGGAPVVVDDRDGTATVLDPGSGAVGRGVALGTRTGERIRASGSATARRLYVVSARGVLGICDLAAVSCDTAVPIGAAGDELGTAVESGNRVFVPDYTSGQVWVVDVSGVSVVARPRVLAPGTTFQLLDRDGVVFFNDPDSEHAGVITLDGGVRPVAKYTTPSASGSSAPPSALSSPSSAPPTRVPTQRPTRTPTTPPVVRTVRIAVSNAQPQVGTDVVLRAVVDGGPAPVSARWSFGDGATGTGLTVTHRWAAAQTYQVSVRASFPDGRGATASVAIQAHNPRVQLSVGVAGSGRVTGGGISCPSTCQVTVDAGTRITLTAKAGAGQQLSGWGGACTGKAATCTVTVEADTPVSATFVAAPPPTLSRSGTLTPGARACVGPFFADGVVGSTHSVHFSGRVTDGSGAALRWTVSQAPTGRTLLDHTAPNMSWDNVNMDNSLYPGDFTACATNETGAPVAYDEFIGKGSF